MIGDICKSLFLAYSNKFYFSIIEFNLRSKVLKCVKKIENEF